MSEETRVGYATIDELASMLEDSVRSQMVDGRYQGDWTDVIKLGECRDYLRYGPASQARKDKTYK
ncbi:hypothetical protein KY363_06935 [Candidatus Woesearchaeota archaeon]|nr:hypothetical protein [Candidatus Woesearchaeota archaeon]